MYCSRHHDVINHLSSSLSTGHFSKLIFDTKFAYFGLIHFFTEKLYQNQLFTESVFFLDLEMYAFLSFWRPRERFFWLLVCIFGGVTDPNPCEC